MGLVHTIAKRDADADPAVVYTSGLPVTTYGAVSHVAPVTSYSAVGHVAPVASYSPVSPVATYTAVNNVVKPVATYSAVNNGVFGPKYIAKNHGVEHVVKRSAEPFVYSTFGHYPVAGHVVKGAYAPHAVAATPFGYTHSSNVGVCTNNMGIQVPC